MTQREVHAAPGSPVLHAGGAIATGVELSKNLTILFWFKGRQLVCRSPEVFPVMFFAVLCGAMA
jgi:hypothetical protein